MISNSDLKLEREREYNYILAYNSTLQLCHIECSQITSLDDHT